MNEGMNESLMRSPQYLIFTSDQGIIIFYSHLSFIKKYYLVQKLNYLTFSKFMNIMYTFSNFDAPL